MREYDVVVVGAGAAGLMAAGTAASRGHRTLLVEKMEKPARKVRITGKGRCNLTNTKPLEEFLSKVKCNRPLAASVLGHFSNDETIRFFERNGLKLATERGDRVFPASGKAWDVADTLVSWARKCGAEIECYTTVERIETSRSGNDNPIVRSVTVRNKNNRIETIRTPNVIVATGGLSYPATGSTGDGYRFAHDLGHRIVEIRPSLVPLETDRRIISALSGVQLRNVNVTLLVDGVPVESEFGEMEFTTNGVSGAVVLRMSREAVDALIDGRKVELSIDLKPALSHEKLTARIRREIDALTPRSSLREVWKKLLLQKLIDPVSRDCGLSVTLPLGQLTDKDISRMAEVLKNYKIAVTDYRPFEESIVTAGGVDAQEIDPATMQSRLIDGLYFAGEVIDIDANTGGYNLQLAFSSGKLAGELKK